MEEIIYIDRRTKEKKIEKIYGGSFLKFLYGKGWLARGVLSCIARCCFFSKLYGIIQKSRLSKGHIRAFIKTFEIDESEFLEPTSSFTCFNDFFIRRLKPKVRPLAVGEDRAILPADGRYLVFENIAQSDGFLVKGKKFSLKTLLLNEQLAEQYKNAAMVIARLCPVDYHRFHFPCSCIPEKARMINGSLFSVNPIALRLNIHYLSENKRMITRLKTLHFGTILFIEVGATCVGTIHQTFTPDRLAAKGDEKGYFSFGGSCIILLFEPHTIAFDADLLQASSQRIETLGLFGQSLGISL